MAIMGYTLTISIIAVANIGVAIIGWLYGDNVISNDTFTDEAKMLLPGKLACTSEMGTSQTINMQ